MTIRTAALSLVIASLLASVPARSEAPAAPRSGFTTVAVAQPAVVVPWTDGRVLYQLTPAQARRLERSGYTLSARDLRVARRLSERGFDGEALVRAYEDVADHAGGVATCVETAAVWRVLELPWRDLEAHCASGRSVSAYVRVRRERAHRLANAGWALTGVGTAIAAVGLIVVFAEAAASASSSRDPSLAGIFTVYVGAPLLGVGTAVLGAGIPMGVLGRSRERRLSFDPEVLDRGTVGQLRASQRRDVLESLTSGRPSFGLSPTIGRQGGGLSLVVRY